MTNNLNKLSEDVMALPDGEGVYVDFGDKLFCEGDDLKSLIADWQRCREALEKYADADTWTNADGVFNGGFGGDRQDYFQGDGNGFDIAREALDQQEGE